MPGLHDNSGCASTGRGQVDRASSIGPIHGSCWNRCLGYIRFVFPRQLPFLQYVEGYVVHFGSYFFITLSTSQHNSNVNQCTASAVGIAMGENTASKPKSTFEHAFANPLMVNSLRKTFCV